MSSSLGAGACADGVCLFSTGAGVGVMSSSLGAGACAAGGQSTFGGPGGGEETTGGDCDGCGEKIIGDGEGSLGVCGGELDLGG